MFHALLPTLISLSTGLASHHHLLRSKVVRDNHHYQRAPTSHMPSSSSAGLQGLYRRGPQQADRETSSVTLREPTIVRQCGLPLKDLVGTHQTPKWATSNAESEVAQFADIALRRFCHDLNAWSKAHLSWICVCCRVDTLLVRPTGAARAKSFIEEARNYLGV